MGIASPPAQPEVSPGTDDRLALLEQRVEDLAGSLRSLEHTVARLEAREALQAAVR